MTSKPLDELKEEHRIGSDDQSTHNFDPDDAHAISHNNK